MPLVRRRILGETKGVVLPAEDPPFAEHAALRRREGIGLLVNPLGESILGDDEARRRVDQVLGQVATGRCRRCLDQGLGAGRQPRRARLRSQRRTNLRADARDLSRCADEGASWLRQPRHGGVPRPAADGRRVHDGARRAGVPSPRGRHRAAGLPARQPRRARAPRRVGRGAPSAAAAPASRSGSSRAPTWRWRRSRPNCTTGSPRRIRRRPMSMRATS